MSKLTLKQEKFCNLYIELGNASEAYRRSYSCSKMKTESINRKAAELLANGKVSARVAKLQEALRVKSEYKKEDALKTLVNIARANTLNYVGIQEVEFDNVKMQQVIVKDLSKLTKEEQACIKSLQPLRGGGVKLELYSRIDAIDRISKMLGWDEPTKVKAEIEHIQIEILDGKDKDE